MFLVYKPSSLDRGEPEEYHFDPQRFPNLDAEACERESGYTWPEFLMQVQKGSTICLRVLLWTFRRRLHRDLKLTNVRFDRGELDLEYDADEIATMAQQARETPEPASPGEAAQRQAAIDRFEALQQDARPAPGKAIESAGDGSTSSD